MLNRFLFKKVIEDNVEKIDLVKGHIWSGYNLNLDIFQLLETSVASKKLAKLDTSQGRGIFAVLYKTANPRANGFFQ